MAESFPPYTEYNSNYYEIKVLKALGFALSPWPLSMAVNRGLY